MANTFPFFDHGVEAAIRNRHSFRRYETRELPPETLQKLSAKIAAIKAPPFGGRPRCVLVDTGRQGAGRVAGTYGMIQGARYFLVGAVIPQELDMEAFGYYFEQAVLLCTDQDLATCWIGATVRRGAFAQRAGVGADEAVPAISPLGVATKRRSLTDIVARVSVSSSDRKPFSHLFFNEDMSRPLTPESAGEYAFCLEMVRLAPSATNRQPWRVVSDGMGFHFFLKRTPGYKSLPGAPDMQRIDMGIALCHFELAASEKGLAGKYTRKLPHELPHHNGMEYVATWLA
ncbi:MAG: nitroreductase family protein [Thermodesulfobacteriota bacterium]